MSVFQAIVLAAVQGATEFIPVSSSGHLVLMRRFLGISDDGGLFFDVVMHAASLLAILVYFRDDLAEIATAFFKPSAPGADYARRLPLLLAIATVPAAVAGLMFGDVVECGARTVFATALSMIMSAAWFMLAERRYAPRAIYVGFRHALLIGCAQVVALLPGASRSGWTTAAGMMCGLDREKSVRFAFLMAIPAIGGALVLELSDEALTSAQVQPVALWAGFIVCFLVSLAAIRFCVGFLRKNSLRPFALYLALAGVLSLLAETLL